MKTCSYCGKEFSDDATICVIDGNPLVVNNVSLPSIEPCVASKPYQSPGVRAAIISGTIFLFISFRIVALGHGLVLFKIGAVTSVLLGCAVAVSVVVLCSRRSRKVWPWMLVIPVTLVSYIVFARLFLLAISIVLGFLKKDSH